MDMASGIINDAGDALAGLCYNPNFVSENTGKIKLEAMRGLLIGLQNTWPTEFIYRFSNSFCTYLKI